jgi:endogenous inhibitor of DNA gyrase (YacG/DUF329 family)
MADTKTVSCAQCGGDFQTPADKPGRPKRYCSDRCRWVFNARRKGKQPARVRVPSCTAPGCDKPTLSRDLCTTHYQRLRLHGALTVTNKCVQCDTLFEADRKKKICSEECKRARALEVSRKRKDSLPLDERKALRRLAAMRTCKECGRGFLRSSGNQSQAYCSRDCLHARARSAAFVRAEAATYAMWAKRAKARLDCKILGNACRDCGVEVRKWAQRCDSCRSKAHVASKERARNSPSTRASRSVCKARYKIRLRHATVERFDPFEVFERDGWRCHMCGVKTPKKLRGTYEDNAPELDHIIPLAAGGEHSRKNTACSCRKCNIAKSDRPLGQLRLIA